MVNLRKLKELAVATAVVSAIIAQASCYVPNSKPGWEYMPDMSNAISYESNSVNPFYADSQVERMPVTGTIPRGVYEPFHFSTNPTGYDSAAVMLHFPTWLDSVSLVEGQRLFGIYCAVCHGTGGKGNGSIVVNDKLKNPFPPPPSYFSDALINIPEGKAYYSVHYGKNLMGAYSRSLDHNQVWKVVYYVKSLQKHYTDSVVMASAKTATASVDTSKKK